MKAIFGEYKENIRGFLNNKKYIVFLIFVSILSYGFFLTHFWIGLDDLSADRYFLDTYILSSGRWGTFLIGNILMMTEFTPFWVECISVMGLDFIAILLCALFKKISNNKLKQSSYILFSIVYISFPQICSFIVYQPTKIPVVISNLFMVIALIAIYENFLANDKKRWYVLLGIILAFPISMYESCCQTFLALMLIIIYIHIKFNPNLTDKKVIEFLVKCCITLLIGIIVNFIINKVIYMILDYFNIKRDVFANKKLLFTKESLQNGLLLKILIKNKWNDFFEKPFVYVNEFLIVCVIGFLIILKKSIKEKNFNNICIYILLIISNFILLIIVCQIMFRICFSWTITIGFIFLEINELLSGKKMKMFWVISGYVVLMQSKNMNTLFYNDYVQYQRTLTYANNIIYELQEENVDFSKPILFVEGQNSLGYKELDETADGRENYLLWGLSSFYGEEIEIINFFNEMGYDLKVVDDVKEAKEIYNNLDEEVKENKIIELEDFVVVKIDD